MRTTMQGVALGLMSAACTVDTPRDDGWAEASSGSPGSEAAGTSGTQDDPGTSAVPTPTSSAPGTTSDDASTASDAPSSESGAAHDPTDCDAAPGLDSGDWVPYVVTSLADAGPGTLRDAVSGSGRVVSFAVGGTIQLDSTLVIESHDLSIDGFSAPSAVTLDGAEVIIEGDQDGPTEQGSNIELRGLRFRGGPDALRIWRNAHDIYVHHCSMAQAGDGGLDITEGAHEITVAWNIVAETAGEGKASLVKYATWHVWIHHNLFYDNLQRNPLVSGDGRHYSAGPEAEVPVADVRYNIVWRHGNYGSHVTGTAEHPGSANIVANLYYTHRTDGVREHNHIIVGNGHQAHVRGNVTVHDCRGGPQFLSNLEVTSANCMSNHDELEVPTICGPDPEDAAGRLAEWDAVLAGAGLIGHFPDDEIEAEARAGVELPDLSIFDAPWNDG